MADTAQSIQAPARPAALGLGEQIARDARTRLVAAGGVVLVHSTYPQGSPVLEAMAPGTQGMAAALYSLVVTFPVHAFVLLSFLNLAPRLDSGVPSTRLLKTAFTRLVPAHLFWVAVYLLMRAGFEGRLPSPAQVLGGAFLGTAAAHLYFTPLLLLLTAAAPLWSWLARTPLRAVTSALGLAVVATSVQLTTTQPVLSELSGLLAMAPVAIAAFALGRLWRGVGPADNRWTVPIASAVVMLCAATLANAAVQSAATPIPFGWDVWFARLGMAIGVPVLLLSASGSVPMWLIRIAPFTLGVYFVHPIFIKALQLAEARVSAFAGLEAVLILPNALLAALCSLAAVMLLARTPLRRCVL